MKPLNISEITEAWQKKIEIEWHPDYKDKLGGNYTITISNVLETSKNYYEVEGTCHGWSFKKNIDSEGFGFQSREPMFTCSKEKLINDCPRCGNGMMSFWPMNHTCSNCGFPGLKSVANDKLF